MKTVKTYSQTVVIGGKRKTLVHYITEKNGIFGLGVRLDAEYAEDCDLTESYMRAADIFDLMCREQVLPLNFYSVIDDLHGEEIAFEQKIREG